MANTTNLNLSKLSGTEKLKTFPTPYSDNMDAIDGAFGAGFGVSGKPTVNAEINSLADGLAIISNNNTHAAITSGQYVYVRGHGSLSNGLYVATSNISANGTLSGSNLTADTAGGLNSVYASLNSKINNLAYGDITSQCTVTTANVSNVNVYRYGQIVIVTGTTKSDVTGTNLTLLKLPFAVKRAHFAIGAYANKVIGEGSISADSDTVKANISTSTDVGSFCVVVYKSSTD